jgi:hypothetical protein
MDRENIVSSFYDSFNYHEKKVEEGVATFIEGSVSQSDSVNIKSKCFELVHSLNSRVKLKGFDIPFTFDSSDKMDDSTFKNLFSDFQNEMGFSDRPYTIYRHNDTDNLHYHVVIGNVNFDGVPNPILRKRYRTKVTKLARELEAKYKLRKLNKIGFSEQKTKTLNEINAEKYSFQKSLLALDGTGFDLSKENKFFLSSDRTNIELQNNPKFQSNIQYLLSNDFVIKSNKQKLISLLDNNKEDNLISFIKKCHDHKLYCRVIKRPKVHLVYGIKDKTGKLMHFKESDLPKRFSHLSIVNKSKSNNLQFSEEKQKAYLKTVISRVAKQSKSIDNFKFILMDKYKIDTILNSNKVTTTGISFKSLNGEGNKQFKGSELDLSYTKLTNMFSLSTSPKISLDTKGVSNPKKNEVSPSKPGSNLSSLNQGKVSSAFGMENFVDDEDDEKKKKKKKRGKGF